MNIYFGSSIGHKNDQYYDGFVNTCIDQQVRPQIVTMTLTIYTCQYRSRFSHHFVRIYLVIDNASQCTLPKFRVKFRSVCV